MPEWCCKVPEDVLRIFEEQLSRVRVDFFDFYLIHNIQDGNWQHIKDMKIPEQLLAFKADGKIGHLGFSFHGSANCLEQVLTQWGSAFEFVQLQLNYFDWEYIEAGKLYDIACAHGKKIIVMEPVRGGMLASLSPEADAVFHRHAPDMSVASFAIRYVMDLPEVVITLSGMSNAEQVEDNLKNASCDAMTEADYAAVSEALDHAICALDTLDVLGADLACTELELAMSKLGELDGRQVTVDVVDSIFHRFCVGK